MLRKENISFPVASLQNYLLVPLNFPESLCRKILCLARCCVFCVVPWYPWNLKSSFFCTEGHVRDTVCGCFSFVTLYRSQRCDHPNMEPFIGLRGENGSYKLWMKWRPLTFLEPSPWLQNISSLMEMRKREKMPEKNQWHLFSCSHNENGAKSVTANSDNFRLEFWFQPVSKNNMKAVVKTDKSLEIPNYSCSPGLIHCCIKAPLNIFGRAEGLSSECELYG